MKTETNFLQSYRMTNIVILSFILFAGCSESEHQFDGSGAFMATEIVVSSEATGTILSLEVVEGQSLTKGQVVGIVDTTLLHLQKEQIQAQILSILEGLPNVKAQTQYFDQQIQLAQITLNHLRKEEDRIRNLLEVEAATQKQLDDIAAQADQAEQKINVLKNQKQAQASALSTQRAGLEAKPMPLQAQMEVINEKIRRSRIVNPTEGTILATYAEEGEYTSQGKPMYRIADLGNIRLKAYIPGNQFTNLKLNQKVTVFTDDGAGGYRSDTGTITWISDKAEFTPKTVQTKDERVNMVYAIKVSLPNEDGRYKIGMYGEIKF